MLALAHPTVHIADARACAATRRPQHGGVALLICALLLGASMMLAITLHRLTVQREQSWNVHRARLQMQALGHGGLMWVMARLEDTRPIDERCRALPMASAAGPAGSSFAQIWAQPGKRLRCQVMLDAPSVDETTWQCDCSSTGDAKTPPGDVRVATLDMAFDAIDDGLVLGIQTEGSGGMRPEVHRWTESIRLRRDANGQWRAVVGTWMGPR